MFSEITPLPLPQAIYDKAKSLGVYQIELSWQGGHDEGYFNCTAAPFGSREVADLVSVIEQWVEEAYGYYGGAGEGIDYGDTVTYNLTEGKVTHEIWQMERTSELAVSILDIREDLSEEPALESSQDPEPKVVGLSKWFKFLKGLDALIMFGSYATNKAASIYLVSPTHDDEKNVRKGETLAVLSVNLFPGLTLGKGEVLIKSYSENEGAMEFLIHHGIIGPSKCSVPTGFTQVTRHDVLIRNTDAWNTKVLVLLGTINSDEDIPVS